MAKSRNLLLFPISIFLIASWSGIWTNTKAAGTTGADIYCLMRSGGNTHEPSWQAAYEAIKNKKPGLFKTSPKQAAAMIVEEVVQDPDKYDACIPLLGELFSSDQINNPITPPTNEQAANENPSESLPATEKGKYVDRYSY